MKSEDITFGKFEQPKTLCWSYEQQFRVCVRVYSYEKEISLLCNIDCHIHCVHHIICI